MLRLLRRLLRNEDGSNLVYTAFLAIPLVGAVGIGTDGGRGYLVRAKLSQALDAAALAGAQKYANADEMEDDIRNYFTANYPDGYMGSSIQGIVFNFDEDNDRLSVTATVTVPTTFMRIFGHQNITVSASTEVTRETSYTDVVMSIDVSGSMAWSAPGGGTRIAAARTAAKTLVDSLFGDNATSEILKIGVVPWNAKVNVTQPGVTYNHSLTQAVPVPSFTNPLTGNAQSVIYTVNNSPVPLLNMPPSNWKGCVYARFKDNGVQDDADTADAAVTHANGDWVAWEPIGNEGEPQSPGRCSAGAPHSTECTPCFHRGIFPLSSSRSGIKDYVDTLTNPTGSTHIAQGLVWAWRALTPAPPFSEAIPDPNHPRTQAIVLLTDGANTRQYGDSYKRNLSTSELDARLRLIASNIKAQGVLIYAIQFANGGGSAQEQLMKDVASEPKAPYYFFAPTAAELQNVFQAIAQHLAKLRLSK